MKKCDKCSYPTNNLTEILNKSVKLCPECAKPIGKHCIEKNVLYETFIASSGLCGSCVKQCVWK